MKFGPFHRIKSPTQTYQHALLQKSSGEIWGKAVKNGGKFPCVKAYLKPLCYDSLPGIDCADNEGIEFETAVMPSMKTPAGQVFWQAGRSPVDGLRHVDDDTIALSATIYKVVYLEPQNERVEK